MSDASGATRTTVDVHAGFNVGHLPPALLRRRGRDERLSVPARHDVLGVVAVAGLALMALLGIAGLAMVAGRRRQSA